jgi:cephalosporin-C deacetylase
MSLPDLPLDELRSYPPQLGIPADAAGFWAGTLADAARLPVAATFERVATGLRLVDTFDVCFAGYGGHPIRGWLHLPASQAGPLPCVVQYVGYGGGRGLAHENVFWPWPATRTSSWTPGDRAPRGRSATLPIRSRPARLIPGS